jgi:hypothetical protein
VPVFSRAFSSLVYVPIDRYATDPFDLRLAAEAWQAELPAWPAGEDGAFAPEADIYFIDVNSTAIADIVERIDRLLLAVRRVSSGTILNFNGE